jgi:hypothetical protein
MKWKLLPLAGLAAICCCGCTREQAASRPLTGNHVLEGGWLASDGTLFVFRPGGTFHGHDWQRSEIWGNWVALSRDRIGFQSLMHDSSYRPQYAIIDSANTQQMHYIVTGGNHFITARRIPAQEAEAAIQKIVKPAIHHPPDGRLKPVD